MGLPALEAGEISDVDTGPASWPQGQKAGMSIFGLIDIILTCEILPLGGCSPQSMQKAFSWDRILE